MKRLLLVLCTAGLLLGGCAKANEEACDTSSTGAAASDPLAGKAATVTDLMAANDWTGVRKDFDARMMGSPQVSEAALDQVWKQVTATNGTYTSRGEPVKIEKPGAFAVYDTPMAFEREKAKSRLTFDQDGRIAGLFILECSVP